MQSINDMNQRTREGMTRGVHATQQRPQSSRVAYRKPAPSVAGPNASYVDQTKADFTRDATSYHAMAHAQASHKRRVLLVVIGVVLALLLASGTAFAVYVAGVSSQLNKGTKTDDELLAIEDALGGYSSNFSEPFYMLLIGSDARPGDDMSRSDTNIVVRVDPIEDQLTILSIPRDTKIEIEGHGTQKFNAAYAFGKASNVITEAENLLGIDISHYAEVNFQSLKELVDAVGGVTVDVEERIDDYHCDDGDGNHYVIEKGTQTLSGGEALTFARSRHYANGDFTRTSNQRKLVEAIIQKVLSTPITGIPGVVSAASQCVTTDLKIMDIIGLAQQFADKNDIVVYSAMVPSYTQNINGISFVINDEEKTAELMELFVAGKDPSGIVSDKTAEDINTSSVDTSNVLLFDDDDEVVSGAVAANTNVTDGSSSTGEGNASGAGAGAGQAGGTTSTPATGGNSGGAAGSSGGADGSGGSDGEGGASSGGDVPSGGSSGGDGSGGGDGSAGASPSGGGSSSGGGEDPSSSVASPEGLSAE